jgi:TPR repeat protein
MPSRSGAEYAAKEGEARWLVRVECCAESVTLVWQSIAREQSMRSKAWIATAAVGLVVIAGVALGWRFYQSRAKLAAETRAVRARAEAGDAEAQARLGFFYERGRRVPQDYGEAMQWYRKAAEQGSAGGEVGLGGAYYYGFGVTPDYAESMRWYSRAAEQGDATGEYDLGHMYAAGRGVPNDDAQALVWFSKAASQGYASAERDLGGMYYYGRAVARNYTEALRWYRKAADQGNAKAEYDLGYMYLHGKGVPADRSEANRWFGKAAAAGDIDAQRVLSLGLSTNTKVVLLIELLGGLYFLSFAPIRLNYLAGSGVGWDRNRKVTVTTGFLLVLLVAVNWYGYAHFQLRRMGVPLNAFTCFKWLLGFSAIPALVYIVWMDRRKRPAVDLVEGNVESGSE